jgi:succinate dehydrogenase cytochrome b subunit
MLKKLFQSPVGKKAVTGVTGLALTGFVFMHMIGNLQYLSSTDAYNEYSHFLIGLGPVLWTIEVILVAFFVFHIALGINIWMGKRKARPVNYEVTGTAGSPSRKTASSKSMIITGIVLGVFLVIHILSFKYGTYYETTVNDVLMRDLARLMDEKFHNPVYAFGYPAVVLLLSVHLRHGIWSAFQSLGATRPSLTPIIYVIGGLLGLAIGIGFLVVPLAIYFGMI